MYIEDRILKNDERVSLKLRDVYRRFGYTCYKMSKFEAYDLYIRNKDFLLSDNVITFNDTDGRLMALKPDVTLSIVKNYKDGADSTTRVYYNENVYRVSHRTHKYQEITQVGLECLGRINEYTICEVASLAAESLCAISERCVLTVSNLAILSEAVSKIADEDIRAQMIAVISEKNMHTVEALCRSAEVGTDTQALLKFLSAAYGPADEVAKRLRTVTDDPKVIEAMESLRLTANQIAAASKAKIMVDLSLCSDMNYYNGIVFQGYVEGVPACVLSGGQYDSLMVKMGKRGKAIGFAVYLDMLERMEDSAPSGVDVLLIYKKDEEMSRVLERVRAIAAQGMTVSAQTEIPEGLIYKKLEYIGVDRSGGENI